MRGILSVFQDLADDTMGSGFAGVGSRQRFLPCASHGDAVLPPIGEKIGTNIGRFIGKIPV